ncbi:MAG TPA: M24 family metallopeptidase [Acidobacteriaceae bacterium]|jgi:Xaa-Pro aminopeptidase|nr:M24 family metallopeptidase [Acidobacteriaceae bacterium]
MDLDTLQAAIRAAHVDAWLFYDHHHRDPIAASILGLPDTTIVTRRWYYVVPAEGEPRKLVHRIEAGKLDTLPGSKGVYSSWQELERGLDAMLAPWTRIAMQYSPNNAIMYVSMVDAGTVEFLRSLGKDIVSSADLVSLFEAVLTQEQIDSHYAAQRALDDIVNQGFQLIGSRARAGAPLSEFEMMLWFREAMDHAGLTTDHGPNVSVNENSSDSHYEPTSGDSRRIASGSFLLIDIWARQNIPGSVWYDITWTGTVNREPSEQERVIFACVRDARDAAIDTVRAAFSDGGYPICGYQADDAARSVIRAAGYEPYFTHRTGHNIGTEIHGAGAHLDNLETHDTRRILPFTCFSVEPGIYLPAFGIRSEINMITSRDHAAVTGRIQRELVRI